MKTLYNELVDAVVNEGLDLETVLQTVTSNVANILKLKRKGGITQDKDADIVLVNKDFGIEYVLVMGKIMVVKGEILKKGTYEK
jgi:beta-aspartyl-dipeptidase (metallo-type)